MYMLYNTGPSIDLCGTPALISFVLELVPFIETYILLSGSEVILYYLNYWLWSSYFMQFVS